MANRIVPFSFKKDGIYYFVRRVPGDLRAHYDTGRLSFSLRTRNAVQASARALAQSAKLDEFWSQLRMGKTTLPGQHRLVTTLAREDLGPSATEALEMYLRLRGNGRSGTFASAATRAIDYLVASKKNKPLLAYSKADATGFRDELFERGLASASVVRIFTSLRAVTTFALTEYGLSDPSPFAGIYLDRSITGPARTSVPTESIRLIQTKCRELDDDVRWLVALISDTGLRLAEAAGLALADLRVEEPLPHVVVRPHPWRSLKTQGSERTVPLVGASLWAAKRIIASRPGNYAFPRYTKEGRTNANSASAALNKWMGTVIPEGVLHGFRHSLRDRLRAVECPSEIADQLGGWVTDGGEGKNYGSGYPLEVLTKWMSLLPLDEAPACHNHPRASRQEAIAAYSKS